MKLGTSISTNVHSCYNNISDLVNGNTPMFRGITDLAYIKFDIAILIGLDYSLCITLCTESNDITEMQQEHA